MALETKQSEQAGIIPAPLATPIDLNTKQMQALVDAINPIIADTVALYIKVRNFQKPQKGENHVPHW